MDYWITIELLWMIIMDIIIVKLDEQLMNSYDKVDGIWMRISRDFSKIEQIYL